MCKVWFQKISILPHGWFFSLNPPWPLWKFQFSFILSFKNFGPWDPLSWLTPWNFQWPSMAWVWIFSGTPQGKQGWHSGESVCLLPLWPGFKFLTQCHMGCMGCICCSFKSSWNPLQDWEKFSLSLDVWDKGILTLGKYLFQLTVQVYRLESCL